MKKVWFGFGAFIVLFAIFGVVFVFGDKIFEVVENVGPLSRGSSASGNDVLPTGSQIRDDPVVPNDSGFSTDGAGSVALGENGGGGESGGAPGCTLFQYVQYSLSNFVEEAECLVYGVEVCEQVKIVCSSNVFNMDYDIGGNFGIVYSLTSGNDTIGYERMEKSVAARTGDVLKIEIVLDGEFDVNSLGCSIDMEIVPKRWLC